MNAERLQAAIEKLEALKAASTEGPWYTSDEGNTHPGNGMTDIEGPNGAVSFDCCSYVGGTVIEDAALIVVLHRTIDAQLSLLRRFDEYRFIPFEEPVHALVDAILGSADS